MHTPGQIKHESMGVNGNAAQVRIDAIESGPVAVIFSGRWALREGVPDFKAFSRKLDDALTQRGKDTQLLLQDGGIDAWDTGLLNFATNLEALARRHEVDLDCGNLPEGAVRLLAMARAVPEKDTGHADSHPTNLLEVIGQRGAKLAGEFIQAVTFLGECMLNLLTFLRGRSATRWQDVWQAVQKSGPEALAITTLISLLVGLILAFVAAQILRAYGGEIFTADLVGLTMTREMGAMMTAIIMCGRTGAAFAAELGSMKTNEEIDALNTLGISPGEFLVLPRLIALTLMMPLLTIYADFVGILGGLLVSASLFDIGVETYLLQTDAAVDMSDFLVGVVKGFVFGFLVAFTGCLRGMQCAGSASAVGDATTSAVVTGITLVIMADAIFAVMLSVLNI